VTTLQTLSDLPFNSRVCLYGAGEVGISLFLLLREQRPDVKVVCFVDSYKSGERHGITIIPPDVLPVRSADYDLVVITSLVFAEQIKQTLAALEVKHYCFVSPLLNDADSSTVRSLDRPLYAFYDRAVSPDGFDIVLFLYLAEIERLQRGYDSLHVVLVPKEKGSFIKQGEDLVYGTGRLKNVRAFDSDASVWYERNVLVPCCWLLSSCGKVSVLGSRAEVTELFGPFDKGVFPVGYSPDAPRENYAWSRVVNAVKTAAQLPSFRATATACDYVRPWLERKAAGRRPISITVRESFLQKDRNSSMGEWLNFARKLQADGFFPVFIRDTGVALEKPAAELAEFCIFAEGSWNLELRMALYELAYINMFTGGGPSVLAHYNRTVRLIRFQVLREGVFECSRQHLEADGLVFGQPLPGATPYQITVWGEERYERMVQVFSQLQKQLEDEGC